MAGQTQAAAGDGLARHGMSFMILDDECDRRARVEQHDLTSVSVGVVRHRSAHAQRRR